MTMAHPRLPRVATALCMASSLCFHAPCPVVSFSFSLKNIYAQRPSLFAYIFQDSDGSFASDGEPLRRITLNHEQSIGADTVGDQKIEDVYLVGPRSLLNISEGSAPSCCADIHSNANRKLCQSAVIDGLVTKEGGELNSKFGCAFSPMERIALTANGNLQRIFSSYYDAPVHVHVHSCTRSGTFLGNNNRTHSLPSNVSLDRFSFRIQTDGAVWDRVVRLRVHDKTICTATSVIHVRSTKCIKLIEDGTIGLGQLFKYLNKLPHFSLLDAGRTADSVHCDLRGGIWRTYELQCEEVMCLIHEEFHHDAWNISPQAPHNNTFKPML